jgi:hypothetical protein
MKYIFEFGGTFLSTVQDVAPIIMLIAFFQILVLKKNIPNLRAVTLGMLMVIVGLSLFLMGLEKALFPIGEIMATQLSSPDFLSRWNTGELDWTAYYWIYIFAALIGFSTTIAEPSLIAVAIKASEVSGGAISKNGLRFTVAIGVGFALAVGTFRIVTGSPLYLYILAGYVIVIIQTVFAPKDIVALAYDSGGVTTSTVTVPIVAALGLGLSATVPGRNPAIDGFGLIAFASVFPVISVLAYVQGLQLITKLKKKRYEV